MGSARAAASRAASVSAIWAVPGATAPPPASASPAHPAALTASASAAPSASGRRHPARRTGLRPRPPGRGGAAKQRALPAGGVRAGRAAVTGRGGQSGA